jgi:hypothetical protein
MNANVFGLIAAVAAPLAYMYPGSAWAADCAGSKCVVKVVAVDDAEAASAGPRVVKVLGAGGAPCGKGGATCGKCGATCGKAGAPCATTFVQGPCATTVGSVPSVMAVRSVPCAMAIGGVPCATAAGGTTPTIVIAEREASADPNRGWLGVQVAGVPGAVAAQVPAAAGGEMVMNVARGSPAEQVGLKQYDIITAVNGKNVGPEFGGVAREIAALAPGSAVTLKVLRGGKELSLGTKLSSRPATNEVDWVHDVAPEAITRESVIAHGKVLSKDEAGNWRLEDLGELPGLENLPESIRESLPSTGEVTTKVFVGDDNKKTVNCVVMREGATIAVERHDDGNIVVKRTSPDGTETEKTYASADAFQAGDKEAFDICGGITSGTEVEVQTGSGADDVLRFYGGGDDWRQQMEAAMKQYQEQMQEAQKGLNEAQKRFRFRIPSGSGPGLQGWFKGDGSDFFGSGAHRAARTFRVNPDGQIEATIRQNDTEVTKIFRNEADLQKRDPALYDAYSKATAE